MGGVRKRPIYKIVVADGRYPRDGKFIEKVGSYNPLLPKDKKPIRSHYPLKGISGNLHLSPREAECVFFLLRGHTIKEVANILDLSPRTIEFYLKNIKTKLSCNKKREVLEIIRQSSFATDPLVARDMQHLVEPSKGH